MKKDINNEPQLIAGALKGDEDAYRRLLNSYKGRIFSYVCRIVKNYHDAEDITFNTFIKCFKSLKSFDPTKSFSTWLYTIAHNLAVDFLRKKKIEYEYLDERYPASTNLVKEYEDKQKLNKIDQALYQLAPIDREIVILFHKEQKSYEEIGEILKTPATTIKTRLHRARLKLRDLLKQR
ncbi:MAG: RNA polymerase sigma factor [candidate division WOR-3 bacterium]|nr:RNA polymerase sigma factor [candidate division WOR-3 bacterium]MDH5684756.1 RNA polymerase sigma factor [candidate division WOR-3 bacterium]